MRSVQVSKPKGPLERVDREIPEPSASPARIKVQACALTVILGKKECFRGIQYPRVPGYEVAGVVDSMGEDVKDWKRTTGRSRMALWSLPHLFHLRARPRCTLGVVPVARPDTCSTVWFRYLYIIVIVSSLSSLNCIPDTLLL
jgi:hypothetical protein